MSQLVLSWFKVNDKIQQLLDFHKEIKSMQSKDSFSTLSYTQYTKFQNRVQTVRGFFEQNLAKTISVYVHKSNDLRRLPKVIFLKFFVTAEACNSSDNQKTKTATWRSQQLSAWIFYPNFFSYARRSQLLWKNIFFS